MQVTHPRAGEAPLPSVVTGPDGTDYRISDGVVDAPPATAEAIADAWGRRFDVGPESLLDDADDSDETGDCPYCDDYQGDNVGIHASQAHPDEWQADNGED